MTLEAMEEPEVGDHWTYELRDEITGDIKSTLTNDGNRRVGKDQRQGRRNSAIPIPAI